MRTIHQYSLNSLQNHVNFGTFVHKREHTFLLKKDDLIYPGYEC